MGNPKKYHFKLSSSGRPGLSNISERWYPGVEELWSDTTSNRPGDTITSIRAIVIHATAGASSEGAMSVMKGKTASWHWLVPDENEPQHGHFVWACAPEKRAAWHVRNDKSHPEVNGGKTKVNHWSLGIEIVNQQDTGGADAFSDWQLEATALIVRYCWAKYPNLVDVVSHAKLDPGRRADPGAHFDWAKFERLVLRSTSAPAEPLVAATRPISELVAIKQETCCA